MHLYHRGSGSPLLNATKCTLGIKREHLRKSPLTGEMLWISLCFSVSALLAEANPSNECSTDRGGPRGKHNFLRGCSSRKTRVSDAFDAGEKRRDMDQRCAPHGHLSLSCRPPLGSFFLPPPTLSRSYLPRPVSDSLARRCLGG